MALYWLINPVAIGNDRKLPGRAVDSTVEDIAEYDAAGALLWPQGNAIVDAAATLATNYRLNRGANEATLESIMQTAVNKVQKAEDAETVLITRTLTAGTGLTGGGDLSADRTFNVAANADGSILANPNDIQVGVLATDAQHGVRGGGTQHAAATTLVSGFLSAADKTRFEGMFSVADKAALALVDGSTLDDHISRYVVTYQQWWLLDKTSALALVDDMIIAAVGGGRWLRQMDHAPKWTNQLAWEVDKDGGSDEASGAPGFPVKTLTEISRRLACFNFTDYTITSVSASGDIPATDKPKWSGRILSEGTPADARQMLLSIIGKRTPVAGFPGGTIGVATATDVVTTPSTGLSQAMITDAAMTGAGAAAWSLYANPAVNTSTKLLVITSGPNAGLTAWTLFANPDAASSVLNAGVDVTRVRVSNWQNTTNAAIGATAAGAAASVAVVAALSGQTYSINDVSSYLAPCNASVGIPGRLQLTYKDFQFTTLFQSRGDGVTNLTTTKHLSAGTGGVTGAIFASQNGALSANGSLIHFSALNVLSGSPSAYDMNGCAFVNVQVSAVFGSTLSLANSVLQSGIVLGAAAGGINRPQTLGMLSVNGAYGLGVYDPPTGQNAITVRRNGIFATESAIHGFGAVAGSLFFAKVDDGGTMLIKTGIVPTGTNTGGQIQLDGATTALQPLESVTPGLQCGTSTLVAGTASIAAVLTAASRIKVQMVDPGAGAITGFATFETPAASRVVGAPGSFVVNAIDDAKALIATAVSTFDWEVADDPPINVPLTTWAQWDAVIVPHVSGFGRNAISYRDGSKIIDFTGAN